MTSAGKHVLVADDGLLGRRLAEHLTANQFTVVVVTDGLSALRELHHRHFDAVITDEHLPYFDGLDLLCQCHLVWPELPVILMSAQLLNVIGPAIAQGAYACLPKPVDSKRLTHVLSEAIAPPVSSAETTGMT